MIDGTGLLDKVVYLRVPSNHLIQWHLYFISFVVRGFCDCFMYRHRPRVYIILWNDFVDKD